jgi:hypothetical protein
VSAIGTHSDFTSIISLDATDVLSRGIIMITNERLHSLRLGLHKSASLEASNISCLKRRPFDANNGIVIAHVRNGLHYLRHFLHHYRSIGVTNFVFIDNESTDGGREYLLSQIDCDVYACRGDFRTSRSGTIWDNIVISQYQPAKWIFHADIDEFAVYDGWPTRTLDAFASACSQTGRGAVTGIMVDMYAARPFRSTRSADESGSLLEDFPCFDGNGYTNTNHHNWRANSFPRQIIDGGPTRRLYGSRGPGWLAKTPLLLEPGIIYLDPHTVLPVALNFTAVGIALLHFRFTGDLLEKIATVERLQYTKGSITEYRLIRDSIAVNPDFSFVYEATQRFTDPQQFIQRNMISALDAI